MPQDFMDFLERYEQRSRPNALEAIGSGMAGFAAPFLGQQWTNPYARQKTDPYQMLMMKDLMSQKKEGRTEVRDTKKLGFQLREEFIKLPEVKQYTEVKTQANIMDSLLGKAMSGDSQSMLAIDQGLINTYNKILDPISVVRESEYARTPAGLSFVNKLQGAYKKLEEGGAGLTNPDRQALVEGAKLIANQRGKTYSDTLQRYKDYSSEMNIPEEYFIKGFESHKDFDISGLKSSNSKKTTGNKIGRFTVEAQ